MGFSVTDPLGVLEGYRRRRTRNPPSSSERKKRAPRVRWSLFIEDALAEDLTAGALG